MRRNGCATNGLPRSPSLPELTCRRAQGQVRQSAWGQPRVRPETVHRSAGVSFPGKAVRVIACVATLCLLLLTSCKHQSELPDYLGEDRGAEYIHHATQISYIEPDQPISSKVDFAHEPRSLRRREKDEVWDMTLAEAIELCLQNSKVIRSSAQFLSPGNPILANPEFATSIYDPALQESGYLFGSRGVEAALSDFDAQLTTQLLFTQNESLQNNIISSGLPAGSLLEEDTQSLSTTLTKRLATGGELTFRQSWNHTGRDIPSGPFATQLFRTVYEGETAVQLRQPLLAGAGAEYTRIAGPISSNIQGVTGVQQGVIIARIDNDQELAAFEIAVQQMLHDVEEMYWQLHLAYRAFDIQSHARDEAMEWWRKGDSQSRAGTGRGGTTESYLRRTAIDLAGQAELARDGIYSAEARLRLLLGLPVNDGRIIRPVDEPISAELIPDWNACLADALLKRPEIRRQKWEIQSLSLQMRAAENLTQPRLDFVGSFQVNGYGDKFFGERRDNNPSINPRVDHALESIATADETGWNLGVEFSMPVGRRFARTQVRSLELQIAKARAMLSEQEVEISHEIANVFRDMARNYQASQNAYNLVLAAKDELRIIKAQYEADLERNSPESIVQTIQTRARAELQFASSLLEYNQNLVDLDFRSGRILAERNIHLAEGPWDIKAHNNVETQFKARRFAEPARMKTTRPSMAPIHDGPIPLMSTLEDDNLIDSTGNLESEDGSESESE